MRTSIFLQTLSILLLPYYIYTADIRVAADVRRRNNNPSYFNIGGVLSNSDSQMYFKETVSHLNFNSQYVPKGVTYDSTAILMDPNPIRTALNVCNYLINQTVYAVVVSHPSSGDLSAAAVSYTSGFYHIPVIGISSRDSSFSDKNIHVSFLRTVPPYSHQADVWMEVLKHFNYLKVIFIHSSDTDGRALLGRFQSTSQSLGDDTETKVQNLLIPIVAEKRGIPVPSAFHKSLALRCADLRAPEKYKRPKRALFSAEVVSCASRARLNFAWIELM
ncbi:Glutamate [NMDA] receptor subunit 1 [Blattella germanica]|nr:Glutamate [NMDA] receptor subunit 1 [Blattella germanica]